MSTKQNPPKTARPPGRPPKKIFRKRNVREPDDLIYKRSKYDDSKYDVYDSRHRFLFSFGGPKGTHQFHDRLGLYSAYDHNDEDLRLQSLQHWFGKKATSKEAALDLVWNKWKFGPAYLDVLWLW